LTAICDALRIELSDLLAAIGRDLADDRARRATVVQVTAFRGDRVQRSGSGDVYCMAA